jgi:hypothetical protein
MKLPECATDRAMPTIPADPDNEGFDTEDEELEYSYRHDGMTLQQDDLDKNRHWPIMNNGVNGVTKPDEEAYFAARCRYIFLPTFLNCRIY